MLKIAHRFLPVLVVSAVIGGPTGCLAQSVPPMAMADVPCDMAMPLAGAGQGGPMAPCKGMTPECIKQMGCIADAALPTRLADSSILFAFSPVTCWSARSLMAGVAREPERLPPRTA